jgi:hypothetical protein
MVALRQPKNEAHPLRRYTTNDRGRTAEIESALPNEENRPSGAHYG